MQGTIAQIIALTTYGNAFLVGSPKFELAAFFPANNTFNFCEYVRFVNLRDVNGKWQESPCASDPAAWFEGLKRDGVYALRIAYVPTQGRKVGDKTVSDRMLVGFVGGGGRWLLETLKPGGSDFWEARWEVGDRERGDRKIWRVTYGRVAIDQPTAARAVDDLFMLKSRLADNLRAIAEFARRQKMDNFALAFEAGLAALDGEDHDANSFELAPHSFLPSAARQLLNTVQAAWVFGAMGSWNDVGFEGEDQNIYERLSEELFQLLNAAIVAAANSSTPSRPQPTRKAWWKVWI